MKERIAEVQAYKASTPCADCNRKYHPECMDFDHLGGDEKFEIVSRLLRGGYSMERVWAEIKKCELVCSNCHRLRTLSRRNRSPMV